MSTNSNNEVDDLMEQNHLKYTKLQIFLRNVDENTMKRIDRYLNENEKNVLNEKLIKT